MSIKNKVKQLQQNYEILSKNPNRKEIIWEEITKERHTARALSFGTRIAALAFVAVLTLSTQISLSTMTVEDAYEAFDEAYHTEMELVLLQGNPLLEE